MIAFDVPDGELETFTFEGSWDGGPFTPLPGEWVILPDTPPCHTSFRVILPFGEGLHTLQVRICIDALCLDCQHFELMLHPVAATEERHRLN